MIFDIGYLILITALVLAAFGAIMGVWGGNTRNTKLIASSFNAVYAVALLVLGAALILWYGLLSDAFELSYVWNHSERALPTFYKFSALWGGQAGSLLFWCLLLSGYSAIVIFFNRNRLQTIMPYANAVMLVDLLVFPGLACLCSESLQACRLRAARRPRVESLAPELLDGDPPGHALPWLCRHGGALCLCRGRAGEQETGQRLGAHRAPLDADSVDVPLGRHHHGQPMGLHGVGLGRLLGVGSRGKRLVSCPGSPGQLSSIPSSSRNSAASSRSGT